MIKQKNKKLTMEQKKKISGRNITIVKLLGSIIFLIVALFIASYAVKQLYVHYPNLEVSRDIFLDRVAFVNLSWLSDVLILVGLGLFVLFVIKKNKFRKIPFYCIVLGMFHLIRAIFIYLTPLANPFPLKEWGLNLSPIGGMFPSGHTATLILYFLFSLEEKSSIKWKVLFLIIIIAEIITLLVSRGHYTIDVLGAIFIAYTVHSLSKKYLSKHLIIK